MRCIRTLFPSELSRYEAHLLRLNHADRRLRFGHPIADDAVRAHVAGLDLAERDRILAHFDDAGRVVGAVHIALPAPAAPTAQKAAEFAFSVDDAMRGHGLGGHLFHRAEIWARNRAIRRAYLYFLTENHAIRALARKAGMVTHVEAGECEARMDLLPATPFTLLSEMTAERIAVLEYSSKPSWSEAFKRVAWPQWGGAAA